MRRLSFNRAVTTLLWMTFLICLIVACFSRQAGAGEFTIGTADCTGEPIGNTRTIGCTYKLPVGPPPDGGHEISVPPDDYGMCGFLSLAGFFDQNTIARIIIGADGYYEVQRIWSAGHNTPSERPEVGWTCVRVTQFTPLPPLSDMNFLVPLPATNLITIGAPTQACIWAGMSGGFSLDVDQVIGVGAAYNSVNNAANGLPAPAPDVVKSYAFCSGFASKTWSGWKYLINAISLGNFGTGKKVGLVPAVNRNQHWCYIDTLTGSGGRVSAELGFLPSGDYAEDVSQGMRMGYNCLPFSQ
jgi:hypothetical protein